MVMLFFVSILDVWPATADGWPTEHDGWRPRHDAPSARHASINGPPRPSKHGPRLRSRPAFHRRVPGPPAEWLQPAHATAGHAVRDGSTTGARGTARTPTRAADPGNVYATWSQPRNIFTGKLF